MRLQIQFQFTDDRLRIAISTQLGYYSDRFANGLIECTRFDNDIINILHQYKDCMVGFKIDKEMKLSTIKYREYYDDEECGELQVWISHFDLKDILS